MSRFQQRYNVDRAKSKNNIAENSFALGHEMHNKHLDTFFWHFYVQCNILRAFLVNNVYSFVVPGPHQIERKRQT